MDESKNNKERGNVNSKNEQLEQFRVKNTGKKLTTDEAVKMSNDEEILKAGIGGPALMEDFSFFQKQQHFNRERIPERVVQARGFGAHGEFELYKSMKQYTRACFLQEPGSTTPVFVRFSNLQGYRGSSDTTLGPRGFSTKFYTPEGNYDLLALSFPVFILNDAFKLADALHALNPEPHNDIPQASPAHDNFWDFVANNQESAHFTMWAMSDATAPRSWRMMNGYSINTFRFVNENGEATFVRFHWKPVLGVHSLLVEEAQTIAGVDPDFHRRDLLETIKQGAYPEFELGVQLIDENDEFKFDFDILDPTKLWPEEIVPVEVIGKMTLNRNVDNFFAEVEQAAFNPANVVPGIDFSNDPVLQGRLFAYRDTQMYRLGSPNINELPINRPICPFHNNQQDGYMTQRINVDHVNYRKNSLANNTPATTPPQEGGYAHYPEKVEGHVTRAKSKSFGDYFSQARLFWNSQPIVVKQHIIQAFSIQVGSVKSKSVRQQVVDMFANVDKHMATTIADNVGVDRPSGSNVPVSGSSPALSLLNTEFYPYTLKVGVFIGNGFNGKEVMNVLNLLQQYGVFIDIISEKLGMVTGTDGTKIEVTKTFLTTDPTLFDSLYIVGGKTENEAKFNQDIMKFISDAYKHYKPIGVATTVQNYIQPSEENNLAGVIFAANNPNFGEEFVTAIAQQRFWNRK